MAIKNCAFQFRRRPRRVALLANEKKNNDEDEENGFICSITRSFGHLNFSRWILKGRLNEGIINETVASCRLLFSIFKGRSSYICQHIAFLVNYNFGPFNSSCTTFHVVMTLSGSNAALSESFLSPKLVSKILQTPTHGLHTNPRLCNFWLSLILKVCWTLHARAAKTTTTTIPNRKIIFRRLKTCLHT